jgi:hypothetical protein
VYQLINDRVEEVLESYTLADLMDPSWVREGRKIPKRRSGER